LTLALNDILKKKIKLRLTLTELERCLPASNEASPPCWWSWKGCWLFMETLEEVVCCCGPCLTRWFDVHCLRDQYAQPYVWLVVCLGLQAWMEMPAGGLCGQEMADPRQRRGWRRSGWRLSGG